MNFRCSNCHFKRENIAIKKQNESLKTTDVYKKYLSVNEKSQKRLESSEKWRNRYNEECAAHKSTKKTLRTERKESTAKEKQQDKRIASLNLNLSEAADANSALQQENEQLKQLIHAADYIITCYIQAFGPLPEMEEAQSSKQKDASDSSHSSQQPAGHPSGDEIKDDIPLAQKIHDMPRDELEKLALDQNKKMNRNSKNSSKPSSTNGFNKQITNNREPSENKPGAQVGSEGYRLAMVENPDHTYQVKVPEKFLNSGRYKKTDKIQRKQVLDLVILPAVVEYQAPVYIDRLTGHQVSGGFPEGVVNEASYGPGVKSIACLLHTVGNMSYGKIQELLRDSTNGVISPSIGWLCGLEKEFTDKSLEEWKKIQETILASKVAHTDGTCVGFNGKHAHILTVATERAAAYWGNQKKGFELANLSFLKDYKNILVHDGEATFRHFGRFHQNCISHELRKLKGIMENEPEVTWAAPMRALLQEVTHKTNEYRKEHMEHFPDEEIKDIHIRYDELLNLADSEYEQMSQLRKSICDGPQTASRLRRNQSFLLLCLVDLDIPTTNNFAELMLRTAKMHYKQNGGVRSLKSLTYFCCTLSVMQTERLNNRSRLDKAKEVFSRQKKNSG